jgi:hypothetical protein
MRHAVRARPLRFRTVIGPRIREPIGSTLRLMGMPTTTPTRTSVSLGSVLTTVGLATLIAAATIYLTGASRVVAVWITPVGLFAAVLGVLSLRGAAVPRWLLVALASVVALMAVLGIATLMYSLAHPPMST